MASAFRLWETTPYAHCPCTGWADSCWGGFRVCPTRSGSDTPRIPCLGPCGRSNPTWASSLAMRDVTLSESGPLSSCYPKTSRLPFANTHRVQPLGIATHCQPRCRSDPPPITDSVPAAPADSTGYYCGAHKSAQGLGSDGISCLHGRSATPRASAFPHVYDQRRCPHGARLDALLGYHRRLA